MRHSRFGCGDATLNGTAGLATWAHYAHRRTEEGGRGVEVSGNCEVYEASARGGIAQWYWSQGKPVPAATQSDSDDTDDNAGDEAAGKDTVCTFVSLDGVAKPIGKQLEQSIGAQLQQYQTYAQNILTRSVTWLEDVRTHLRPGAHHSSEWWDIATLS